MASASVNGAGGKVLRWKSMNDFSFFFLLREIEFIDLYKSVELWAAISLRQLLRRAFFIDSQRETS